MASMVKKFVIGPDDTRVAVVVFATNAQVVFQLDTYTDENSVLNAIAAIPYTGGNTNTGDALKLTADSKWLMSQEMC